MRGIVKVYKAALLLLLNLTALFPGTLISAFRERSFAGRLAAECMSVWARFSCAILGIRIKKNGNHKPPSGSLIVANHISYLDILVLGSLVPVAFVAKDEVASWPLLGRLSRSAGTIFVNRNSRISVLKVHQEIESRLTAGISVLLFPEGTTSNGTEILSFKSSFFEGAAGKDLPVLPVSLIYSHIDATPIGAEERDRIAWHGDMSLLPHIWHLLGMKRIDVWVRFNPVIQGTIGLVAERPRKLVSSMTRESVVEGHRALQADVTENL